MLKSIDMVVIYVRDWPQALTWYRDQVGLTIVYTEDDHNFAVLALPEGGTVLHIVGDLERPGDGRNRCVPNLRVDDFDTTLNELRSRGVEVLKVQDDEEDGYRLATVADPEGNELNLYVLAPAATLG